MLKFSNQMHRKWAAWFLLQAARNNARFAAENKLWENEDAFNEVAEFIAEQMKMMTDPPDGAIVA